MKKISAGLLMYRVRDGRLEVFLVHPGGPFFQKKDLGAWSIPKGEIAEGEEPIVAASREFEEETNTKPQGKLLSLGCITQKSGKIVHAWAFEGDCDPALIRSNTFLMEWPPRSGKKQEFPEIDRADFFDMETAKAKINEAQVTFLENLGTLLPGGTPPHQTSSAAGKQGGERPDVQKSLFD